MIEEMQHYYDRRAQIYDTSMGYDNPDTVTKLQPVIEHICREMSGKKVLELACGPCFWTQFTAAVAESIVACDFNNSTLSQARHKDCLGKGSPFNRRTPMTSKRSLDLSLRPWQWTGWPTCPTHACTHS